jgi:hypothetical protein
MIMALRTMYDAVNMDAIPLNAGIVAGYPHRGGDTVWNPARFPHSLVMAIDQHGNHPDDCHAADYEAFAIFGPAAIRQWVTAWHQLHPAGLAAQGGYFTRPVVYSDEANLTAVRGALAGLVWDLWVAAWPGAGSVLQDGAAAHQFSSETTGSGGPWDLSVVSPSFGTPPPPPDDPPDWRDVALAQLAAVAGLIRAHTP